LRAMSEPFQQSLRRYVELLQRWNKSINLVSRADMPLLWQRHIADSLQLGSPFGPLPSRAIDLGSGAGLPGMILAIRFRLPVALIEEDQRKAAFLREAARVTGAPVTVHAEAIERTTVPPAPLVVARGLAPVARLLGYAERLLEPGGECWFPKSRAVDAELAEAALYWTMKVERVPSLTDVNGIVLRLSEIARVGDRPPRFPAAGPHPLGGRTE
jgi:16S rRNA (guanine527-N7)-methyltransferase